MATLATTAVAAENRCALTFDRRTGHLIEIQETDSEVFSVQI